MASRLGPPLRISLLCAGLIVTLLAAAGSHSGLDAIPRGPDGLRDPQQLKDYFDGFEESYTGEFNDEWEKLDEAEQDAVEEIYEAETEADHERLKREARREARRRERFKRTLESMRGDEWAAYTAAFFSSTLFETDKSFKEAVAENLTVVGQNTGRTLGEVVDDMNAEVRAEAIEAEAQRQAAQQERLREIGRQVLAGYDAATQSVVTDIGFLDYPSSNVVNRSALMVRDGFIGNGLQILYQVNLLKTAAGDIPEGNFVTLPPHQAYNTVNANLTHIGRLKEEGADSSFIDAKTEELREFVELPGMQPTRAHFERRSEFIDFLTPLAENVAENYYVYDRVELQLKTAKVDFNMWTSSTRVPGTLEGREAYAAERDAKLAEIAELEERLQTLTPEQSEYDFLLAKNQSPFLSAPIEVDGFEGELWEYLAGPIQGYRPTGDISHRTPEKDQQALDQAIAHLETLGVDVLLEYGTVVNSEELIRIFGSPSFKALRVQLAEQLEPIIPNTNLYFGELEGLFDREWAETQYSRAVFDVGTGLAAIAVGGVIIIFPVTAPVLVPVELALLGTEIGVQSGRLIIASQDYAAAEELAQSGSGDNTALSRYDDALTAETRAWLFTVALAPLGVKGSMAALDEAARLAQQTSRTGQALAAAADGVDDLVRIGPDATGLVPAASNPAIYMRAQYGGDVPAARAYEIAVKELGIENVDGIAGSYARGNPRRVGWPADITIEQARRIDKAPDSLPDNLVEMLPAEGQAAIRRKRELRASGNLPSDLDLPTTVSDKATLNALQAKIFSETGVYVEFTQSRIARTPQVGVTSGTQRFRPGTFDPEPPPAGPALDDTQIFRPGTFDPEPPGNVDIDAFRNMTPEDQAAALQGLSDTAQAQLVCQLSKADQQALGTAKVYNAIVNGLRENPEVAVIRKPGGNTFRPMTAADAAAMTDDELRVAVRNGDVMLSREANKANLAEIGDDLIGPFSPVKGVNEALGEAGGDLPPPGYWAPESMTDAEIDELFGIDVGSLPVAERQKVILKRADVIRQGRVPTSGMNEETSKALAQTMISHLQRRMGRELRVDELMEAGWRWEWGRPPALTRPHLDVAADSAAQGSGMTVIGEADESFSTVIGGAAPGSAAVAEGAGQAPLTGWRLDGDIVPGAVPGADAGAGAMGELPNWLFFPGSLVPGGGAPSFLRPADGPVPDEWFDFMPQWFNKAPSEASVDDLLGQTQTFPRGVFEGGVPGDNALDETMIFPFGTFEGGIPPGGTCSVGGSSRALRDGGSLVYLRPSLSFEPGRKPALWQNFMYRTFMVGACQGDWTRPCTDEIQVGVLSVPENMQRQVAGSLSEDGRVWLAQPNAGRQRQANEADPLFTSHGSWEQKQADQWGLHAVGLDDAGLDWQQDLTEAEPVVVAVIDTGLAWSHPDFSLRTLWINQAEIPGNNIDDDENGYIDDVAGWNFLDHTSVPWDLDGHGTLVASIIAAQSGNGIGIAGVNPNVRIMPLKAVNNAGESRASYLAEAIVYATNNGARIINLSVGGADLTLAEQLAVDFARSAGVLVIAAAGNEGTELDDYGPAAAPGVLTVAASDPDDQRLPFSNWGQKIDVAAPGSDIVGLRAPATDLMRTADVGGYRPRENFVGDDQLYYRATGTSFAAPIVAGVASLVWSENPSLGAADVRRIIEQSARDIGTPGRDQFTGYGLVDARAALGADPAFFIDVVISGVAAAEQRGRFFMEVLGTLDANELERGWLEYGPGENPGSWQRLERDLKQPVRNGSLGRIPAEQLGGAKTWTIRLLGEHRNGQRREFRFRVNLG